MKRQRRITPPVYNERGVIEQPIPMVDAARNGVIDSVNDVEEQPNDNRADEEFECLDIQPLHDNVVETNDDDSEEEERMIDEVPESGHDDSTDPLLIKTEDPYVVINNASDADMVDDLAECCYETIGDDITVYYDDISAFKPKKCDLQIKRKDVFSGTLPIKEYVSEKLELCRYM